MVIAGSEVVVPKAEVNPHSIELDPSTSVDHVRSNEVVVRFNCTTSDDKHIPEVDCISAAPLGSNWYPPYPSKEN